MQCCDECATMMKTEDRVMVCSNCGYEAEQEGDPERRHQHDRTDRVHIQQRHDPRSGLLVVTVIDLFEKSTRLVEFRTTPDLVFVPVELD